MKPSKIEALLLQMPLRHEQLIQGKKKMSSRQDPPVSKEKVAELFKKKKKKVEIRSTKFDLCVIDG